MGDSGTRALREAHRRACAGRRRNRPSGASFAAAWVQHLPCAPARSGGGRRDGLRENGAHGGEAFKGDSGGETPKGISGCAHEAAGGGFRGTSRSAVPRPVQKQNLRCLQRAQGRQKSVAVLPRIGGIQRALSGSCAALYRKNTSDPRPVRLARLPAGGRRKVRKPDERCVSRALVLRADASCTGRRRRTFLRAAQNAGRMGAVL